MRAPAAHGRPRGASIRPSAPRVVPDGPPRTAIRHSKSTDSVDSVTAMDDRDAIAAELGASWFGAGLSLHARARLADRARLMTYPGGAVLTREGDETALFAIVVRGRVALRMRVPERGTATILTVEPGDVVGWSALVPPHRSTSTAVTSEPTTLLVFEPKRLREVLEQDLPLAATLYPRLLEAIGRRLSATRGQLLDLYAQQAEPVAW